MKTIDVVVRDGSYESEMDEKPRAKSARRSRGDCNYARNNKRTTHFGGMHRRRTRRWNW